MPEYNVHHTGYVSHVETIEAASPEDAIAASEVGSVGLCHQCTREWDAAGDPEIFTVTDSDGETVWESEPYVWRPTVGEIKAAIRSGLGGDTEEGCGCESHICSAADAVLALINQGGSQ